jgi:autotransporter passenger strand-loop-strand repeat protein
VSSGGYELVMSGGTASGTTVSSGGREVVSSGGTASGTTVISGGYEVVMSGGTASGTTVSSGGTETVSSGGIASGATVLSGSTEYVYGGGTARGAVLSAGALVVSFGGLAIGTTISSGGREYVSSGGSVSGTTLSGGFLEIQSGGTVGTSQINFSSVGGTLQLDDSVHFSGTISGFGVPGGMDLRDIAFSSATTLGFTEAGDNLSGTLTISDGTHAANITLLGQYVAGNFTKQSDGNGRTLVTDPPVVAQDPVFSLHPSSAGA